MKILLATYWLLPHVGGVHAFMEQIRKAMSLRGHQVDLFGHSPDYKSYHMYSDGRTFEKAHVMPMIESKLSAATSAPYLNDPVIRQYELDRYCLELAVAFFGLNEYDVIHTQDVFSARSLARVKPRHTPLVAHIHGSVAHELRAHFRDHPELGIGEQSPAWRYCHAMEYYGASSADIAVTANQWMKTILTGDFGVDPSRIEVFPYGLDTETFRARSMLATPINKPPGKKVIACSARLTFVKGIDLLITALAQLKNVRQDWVCWLIGDGELRGDLERQARALGLQDDIVFWGFRQDAPALLAMTDIFVHACILDNQPISVIEAQLAGTAVVVSDAGGLPEMVEHGHTGLVFPSRDTGMLCAYLYDLLEHGAYRARLAYASKKWAEAHWSMDAMIERLADVYERAGRIAQSGGRGVP
ncbi:Glycosyltransferase involved in cell wall bisynthesis [Cohnella sp. OV330]|uniref:glycosyltransferase family 4 protein n=1 Tax=Cohnella sp. OV330 TaxID=1855288 RepID=UPI0008F0B18B|nr:glycosyltransferase family 4 protein [Cohnella sp. OV330]SFB44431.1 Glycosyltransferase involved in cell wall bisynthesis [Cohnella sp. OV330]